jgi:hypothetical protein
MRGVRVARRRVGQMHERWPTTLAMTVCSLTVLSTAIAAFMALNTATPPLALSFGGLGLIAAFMGLFAVIQWARQVEWLRQAEGSIADYRHRLAVRAREQLAEQVLAAANRAEASYSRRVVPLRDIAIRNYGGNVVPFDLVRMRARRQRLHRL